MRRYRCRHVVEAARWADSLKNREWFASWFDEHDQMFLTRGPVIELPNGMGQVQEGEWLLWMMDEFVIMSNEEFIAEYEPL